MSDKNINSAAGEVEIREAARVLIKKKWWALGIFFSVALVGLLYIFFRAPLYSTESRIYVNPATVTGNEKLAEYFPEQYNRLFLVVPNLLLEDLKSNNFTEQLKDRVNIDIKSAELKNRLYMHTEHETIVLRYIDSDPDSAYKVDEAMAGLFIDRNNTKLSNAYNDLIDVVGVKLAELSNNISMLSDKMLTDGNPALKNEFNLACETYYTLIESKKVLTDNKDFFTSRFSLVSSNDPLNVLSYYNKKRDAAFVVLLAAALALMGTFMVNHIQEVKKKD